MTTDARSFLIDKVAGCFGSRRRSRVAFSLTEGGASRAQEKHYRAWPYPVVQCVAVGRIVMRMQNRYGEREESLRQGDFCYSVPGGWDIRQYGTNRNLLVFAFPSTHVRVHWAHHEVGNGQGARPTVWHHTARPLCAEGQAVLQALNENAQRRADEEAGWHLLQVLGGLVADALREDRVAAEVSAADATYRMLLDYVIANACRPIDRNLVAREFGLAPDYVSRLFARRGERFNHLLNRLRLDWAENLVLRSTNSVRDIALQCGFASDNYFVKAFRKRFGASPGVFRRDHTG